MKIFSEKKTLILLAAIALIGMAIIALSPRMKTSVPQPKVEVDLQTQKLETQSESTEIQDIERDINQTDLNNLDMELQDIQREIDETL